MIITNDGMLTIPDATVNTNSEVFDCFDNYSLSIITNFSANVDGTLKMQISNDNVSSGSDVVNWFDKAVFSTVVTSTGHTEWNFAYTPWRWIRLVWTDNGSTSAGAIQSFFAAKRLEV